MNTVVAPPRMLIAFLENNLNEDGSVSIPKALQPYMGGMTKIEKKARLMEGELFQGGVLYAQLSEGSWFFQDHQKKQYQTDHYGCG